MFSVDPLRVLRAVRFAARFDFELEQTLQQAAANERVRKEGLFLHFIGSYYIIACYATTDGTRDQG